MAQNFSNVLTGNPAANALNSRLNPSPLQFSPVPGGSYNANLSALKPPSYINTAMTTPRTGTLPQPSPQQSQQAPAANPQSANLAAAGTGTGLPYSGPQNNGTISTASYSAPQGNGNGLYGQIVNNLANVNGSNATGNIKAINDLQNDYTNKITGLEKTGLGLNYGTGAESILQTAYNNRLGALQTGLTNTLGEQGQQITGLQAAGGLAAPIQTPYSSQVLNPVSGQPIQGTGANGGELNPINQIPQLAQDVIAGRKSPSVAAGLLGNNPAFSSMLNAEISKINPNFNFQQAETNAQTQGTLAPSIQNASGVLNNLQTSLSNAPWWTNTGVPMINQLGTLFSKTTGVGLQGTRELEVASGDARNAISNALGSAYNTTPSSFDAYVKTLIPDNPTPADVQGAINQLGGLFGIRTNIYSQPGSVPQFTGGAGAGQSGGSQPAGGSGWSSLGD